MACRHGFDGFDEVCPICEDELEKARSERDVGRRCNQDYDHVELDRLYGNFMIAKIKELAEARREIDFLRHQVSNDPTALSDLAACREERDQLRADLEKVKHGASRLRCDKHKTDASFAWGCPVCVEELRADLDRLRLRWRTGPVPEDGWYCCKDFNEIQHMVKGFCPVTDDKYRRMIKWFGPIPEPEEEA